MRSRRRMTVSISVLPLMIVACGFTSGCQLGRTVFHMDSNSPSPFLGLNLLPSREKKSSVEGVSRFQDEPVSQPIETAEAAAPPPREAKPRSWAELLGRAPRPETMKLPAAKSNEDPVTFDDAPVEQFR